MSSGPSAPWPRYRAESLERRLVLASIPVTLNITDLLLSFNPDADNPIGGDGDFYAEVTIGNEPEQTTENRIDNPVSGEHLVNPAHWTFTEFVDPADFEGGLIPVQIQVFDSDDNADDRIDITPDPGNNLQFAFDPAATAPLQGQATGNGDGDVDARITFEMFKSMPLTVAITEFQQLESPELGGGDGSFKYYVKIGDHREQDTGSFSFPPGKYGPSGMTFGEFLNPQDLAANPVVRIHVHVEDVDLASGNDTMDLNPREGESDLDLDYNVLTGTWTEVGGAFSSPQNFSAGVESQEDDAGKIFFDIGPGPDTDGDGLYDFWETNGIDANLDGTVDLFLGTDPRHKDLFVEIDAMQGLAPDPAALADVVAAFAAVPESLVDNPDNQDGISLHLQLDETNIPAASWAIGFPEFDLIKQNTNPAVPGGFGTPPQRGDPNAANILAAKERVYRYSIFARDYGGGTSSGQAELNNLGMDGVVGGNDFYVTLGSVGGGSRTAQSGTFMHELGHTLGLFHGGHQASESLHQYKPNYHSVMNYTWQFKAAAGPTSGADVMAFANSWTLDYSREAFDDLNEDSLSESAGIGGHAGHTVKLRNGPYVTESGPVDWDQDGTPNEAGVARDLNDSGDTDTLEGSVDWDHLLYGFRNTRNFADGEHGPLDTDELTIAEYADFNDALIYAPVVGDGADQVTLRLNGADLQVLDGGAVVASRPLADTRVVQIFGSDGESDTLTVDFGAGGFFAVPDGIAFDGGSGAGGDRLRVVGTGATTGSYAPSAATPGSGTATVSLGGSTTTIGFSGLEPVEVTDMASYAMVTPNGADAVALTAATDSAGASSYAVAGTSGGVAFETLLVSDVTTFTLDAAANDAGSPNDTVTLAPGTASAGVGAVNVLTGAGADAVTVSASPQATLDVNLGGGGGDVLNFQGESLTFAVSGTAFTAPGVRAAVTYAGAETLALINGTFHANGSVAPAAVSADVVVDAGAVLGGTGRVLGAVDVNAGGTVDPGVAGPGALGSGDLTLSADATFRVQLNGLTAGSQHDQLAVSGAVDLGNGVASIAGSIGPSGVLPGDAFVVLLNNGTDPVLGRFEEDALGLVTVGGKRFEVDYAYDGGDGFANDVALIAYGAALGPDPCDPKRTALYVSATTGDDAIRFVSATGNSRARVLINGHDEGVFQPSGLLLGFGQAGDDTITVEMPSRAAWLYGQGDDDVIRTGNSDSILVGGAGDDDLSAGNGKDILIGGTGEDTLVAGNGEDLLVAGATAFDANTPANRHAFCHVQDEWLRGSGGYAGRIAHLRAGGGRNGAFLLSTTSVPPTLSDDNAADDLLGNNGQDWFVLNSAGAGARDTSDKRNDETATDV